MWLHPGLGVGGGRRSKVLDIESLAVCSQAVCLFVGAVITKAAAISALLLCKSVEHIWSFPLKTPSMLLGKKPKTQSQLLDSAREKPGAPGSLVQAEAPFSFVPQVKHEKSCRLSISSASFVKRWLLIFAPPPLDITPFMTYHLLCPCP